MNIELCGAEEVADAFGIKLDTLYRYARKGRLRGMKVGKSWRFLQADIQEFLKQHQYRVKPAEHTPPFEVKPSLLPDILHRAALESGVERAIACGGAKASYADINQASNLLADSLLSHGVVPGDRVLLLLSNSLEFVAGCFAVWKAGSIVVAEDPSIQDANLCAIMQDCTPQALIVDRDVAERLDVRRHGLENLRVIYVKGRTFGLSGLEGVRVGSLDAALENKTSPTLLRFNSSSPDDIATITYPGGAAQGAKGVMNTHENWLTGAAFTGEYHSLTKQDLLLLPLPLHQSLGLRQLLAYVMAGARIILASDLTCGEVQQGRASDRAGPPARRSETAAGKIRARPAKTGRIVAVCRDWFHAASEGKFESLRRLLPQAFITVSCNLTEAQAGFLKRGRRWVAQRDWPRDSYP